MIDGGVLARFHDQATAPDTGIRLVDYAESPRVGEWTLRAALVRYAQPVPAGASAVLELVRRTDGALKPFLRALDAHVTATDPVLSAASFPAGGAPLAPSPAARLDARAADLARLALDEPEQFDRVLGEYEAVEPLDDDERAAIPVLAVAVELDRLGDVLARWAHDRGRTRPDREVDELARRAFAMLGSLGIERERRPPRRS